MRDRSRARPAIRPAIRLAAAAPVALALSAPLLLGAGPEAAGTSVRITVTELRNAKGVVMACMTDNPDIFPRCREDADSFRASVSAEGEVTFAFDHVRPGTYAIALLHDENENGKSDRALSMIPKEGFGFSRDAPVRFGPPDFDQAAFTVGSTPVRQTIRMRYLL